MTNPIRVLVIDDSALMRKMLTQMLERDSSIEVVGTAMDGSFGLKKIDELRPDVVTLDLEMPQMDGLETLREINRRGPLPVIVVSAHTPDGASGTFKALQSGAFDFIAKPRKTPPFSWRTSPTGWWQKSKRPAPPVVRVRLSRT